MSEPNAWPKFYIIDVTDPRFQPSMLGPYSDAEDRRRAALEMAEEQGRRVIWLDIHKNGTPFIGIHWRE